MFDNHVHPDHWGIVSHINLFGYNISTYSLFILLGILAAIVYYKYETRGLNEDMSSNALLIAASALIFGTLGAKIPSAIELFYHNPGKEISYYLMESGRTVVGGLAGGFIGVKLIKKVMGIKEKRGNQLAPAIAIGLFFGRIGCFFTGCCYGIPSRLGVNFGDSIMRHPTQLYEASFHLIAFIVMVRVKGKKFKPGMLLKLYFLSYFIQRFLIEFIRVNPRMVLGMSGYQFASLVLGLLVGLQLYNRKDGIYE